MNHILNNSINKTLIPLHKKFKQVGLDTFKISNNIDQILKSTDTLQKILKVQNYIQRYCYNNQIQQSIIKLTSNYNRNLKLLSSFNTQKYKTQGGKETLSNKTIKNAPVINSYEETCIINDNIQNSKCIKNDNSEQLSYYKLEYNDKRQLTLEGKFLLAKTNFNSKQDNILLYLFKNPNKIITLEEFESAINDKITSPLRNIVKDLGFKGKIKEAFIDVNINSIEFNSEITKSDYKKLSNSFIPIQCKTPKKIIYCEKLTIT